MQYIKTQIKSIELRSFLKYGDAFHLSIGYDREWEPKSMDGNWRHKLLRCYFIYHMLNLNCVLAMEVTYVFLAIARGTNFLEATMNLSFIGFTTVADLKMWLIWRSRDRLTQIVRQLEQLHPVGMLEQVAYGVGDHLRGYSRISIFYFSIHVVLVWSYNLYWAIYYIICDFWLGIRSFERILPYYIWAPWNWRADWIYHFMYVSEIMCGHCCLAGQLAADLLMCALVTLAIMHFTRLGAQLDQHVAGVLPQTLHEASDIAFLQASILYHQSILQLCEDINEMFGISLLCNFGSSAFVICFVGFQLTMGGHLDNLVMLVLFLFCALVQVFVISSYSQRLLDASERVGESVYSHDWFHADLRYGRMLVLIMQRSQQPSQLQATRFLKVSLVTMTELLQLSYKFFALLRTMYAE